MDCGDLSLEVAGVFVLFVSVEWSNCRVASEYRRVRDVCGFLSHGLQTRRPCVALNIILTRADVLADLLTRVLADGVAGGVVREMTCPGNRRGPY